MGHLHYEKKKNLQLKHSGEKYNKSAIMPNLQGEKKKSQFQCLCTGTNQCVFAEVRGVQPSVRACMHKYECLYSAFQSSGELFKVSETEVF